MTAITNGSRVRLRRYPQDRGIAEQMVVEDGEVFIAIQPTTWSVPVPAGQLVLVPAEEVELDDE